MRRVYFDHIAATPLQHEALQAMLPFLKERFGNAQSLHSDGQAVLVAMDEARQQIARLINASESEIYFTSSGSESNNCLVFADLPRPRTGALRICCLHWESQTQLI